jgi:hypothetical protein
VLELLEYWEDDTESRPWFQHKMLERKRVFLGHLAMTFDSLVPFMKGFHLTIDSWRSQRSDSGWKMRDKDWSLFLGYQLETGKISQEDFDSSQDPSLGGDAPLRVQSAPGLDRT